MKIQSPLAATLAICVLFALSSCAAKDIVYPTNDEVLTYQLPFDLTFLRTFEAVEQLNDWMPEDTEKEKGLLNIRNVNYSRFADSDKRQITILVERVDRATTVVRLAPESIHVIGGEQVLEIIKKHLDHEVS